MVIVAGCSTPSLEHNGRLTPQTIYSLASADTLVVGRLTVDHKPGGHYTAAKISTPDTIFSSLELDNEVEFLVSVTSGNNHHLLNAGYVGEEELRALDGAECYAFLEMGPEETLYLCMCATEDFPSIGRVENVRLQPIVAAAESEWRSMVRHSFCADSDAITAIDDVRHNGSLADSDYFHRSCKIPGMAETAILELLSCEEGQRVWSGPESLEFGGARYEGSELILLSLLASHSMGIFPVSDIGEQSVERILRGLALAYSRSRSTENR